MKNKKQIKNITIDRLRLMACYIIEDIGELNSLEHEAFNAEKHKDLITQLSDTNRSIEKLISQLVYLNKDEKKGESK